MPPPLIRLSGDIPRADAPEELIHGLLSASGLLHFYGSTGCGKTHFILQCAWLWADGLPAFGMHPARPLNIMYCQSDMGKGHYARLKYAAKDAGINVPDKVLVVEFPPGSFKDITHTAVATALTNARASYSIDMVIVDVADKMHSENPNDGQAVQRILLQWERVLGGRALIYVRHPRKKMRGSDPVDSDLDESSGHLNWSNSCDSVLRLTPHNLLFEKTRIGPTPRSRPLVMDIPGGYFRLKGDVVEDQIKVALHADPTLSTRALARLLNIPETTCRRVIKTLRLAGEIPLVDQPT